MGWMDGWTRDFVEKMGRSDYLTQIFFLVRYIFRIKIGQNQKVKELKRVYELLGEHYTEVLTFYTQYSIRIVVFVEHYNA